MTTDELKQEKRRHKRLRQQAEEYAREIYHTLNNRINMFHYPKSGINTSSWNLRDLYERTQAAQQLGYEVILSTTDDGLFVKYQKKLSTGLKYFY